MAGELDLRKVRVLVIDDSAEALEILCATLRGFRVREPSACETVEAARKRALEAPFDLILADCEMPGEDGVAFTRWLRSEAEGPNRTAPVVLLSAFTAEARMIAARDAGANMVVAKPVIPAALLSRIEWVARNPRNFIFCETYRGPDRRVKNVGPPSGVDERRANLKALTADADRALSQNDIDSLFG